MLLKSYVNENKKSKELKELVETIG